MVQTIIAATQLTPTARLLDAGIGSLRFLDHGKSEVT